MYEEVFWAKRKSVCKIVKNGATARHILYTSNKGQDRKHINSKTI